MVNYNVRSTQMKLSHNWKLFGFLISLTHVANGQVVFDLQGTSCKSENITLGCTISLFTTDATWKRGDGSVLAVTCSSAGPCSQVSQIIDGTKYSFQGNTSGIYMSTQLPPSEHGVNWTCTYSSNEYIYQFELGCSTTIITTPRTTTTTTSTSKAPTTASISTTKIKTTNSPTTTSTSSTTSTVTPTSSPTHSTTPNTCRIFFKEKPCALNYLTLAEIVVFVIASFCVVGYFIIRNRKHQ